MPHDLHLQTCSTFASVFRLSRLRSYRQCVTFLQASQSISVEDAISTSQVRWVVKYSAEFFRWAWPRRWASPSSSTSQLRRHIDGAPDFAGEAFHPGRLPNDVTAGELIHDL